MPLTREKSNSMSASEIDRTLGAARPRDHSRNRTISNGSPSSASSGGACRWRSVSLRKFEVSRAAVFRSAFSISAFTATIFLPLPNGRW